MHKHILVVEDDRDLAKLILFHLKTLGYTVEIESDGVEALRRARSGRYSLLVLDLMLPNLDGLEICKALRQEKHSIGILMLTKKSAEIERVLGLELGADDYLTKPFGVLELVARVKALMRRLEFKELNPVANSKDSISVGALQIDLKRRRVALRGSVIATTAKEFDLLSYLASYPGQVFTRAQLLRCVWGYESSVYEHTVSSHVNRLRSKIEVDATNAKYILTVWGYGYRFAESEELVSAGPLPGESVDTSYVAEK